MLRVIRMGEYPVTRVKAKYFMGGSRIVITAYVAPSVETQQSRLHPILY